MCACVVFLDAYCVRLNVDVHCVVSCLFLCSTLIRRISSLLYYDYLLIIFTCCYFDNVLSYYNKDRPIFCSQFTDARFD